jgi:hypothetical protein
VFQKKLILSPKPPPLIKGEGILLLQLEETVQTPSNSPNFKERVCFLFKSLVAGIKLILSSKPPPLIKGELKEDFTTCI